LTSGRRLSHGRGLRVAVGDANPDRLGRTERDGVGLERADQPLQSFEAGHSFGFMPYSADQPVFERRRRERVNLMVAVRGNLGVEPVREGKDRGIWAGSGGSRSCYSELAPPFLIVGMISTGVITRFVLRNRSVLGITLHS